MLEHAMLLQGVELNVTENCNAYPSSNQALNTKLVEGFGALAELEPFEYLSAPQNHGFDFEDSYLRTCPQ